MAAISTNGTGGGLWSATSTWSGGALPNLASDTITVASTDTLFVDIAAADITGKYTNTSGFLKVLPTGTLPAVPSGKTCHYNEGVITSNAGTVTVNSLGGVITTNASGGVVTTNASGATVTTNASGATVTTNNGAVVTNASGATVTTNNGVVVHNAGTCTTNNHVIFGSTGTLTSDNCACFYKAGSTSTDYETFFRNLLGKAEHHSDW
jgi:hypothetical protein